MYAGALFITEATKIQGDYAIYIAIVILLAIACIFTVAGGLTAVIWTDFIQTILMIVGALVVCVKCKYIHIYLIVVEMPMSINTMILYMKYLFEFSICCCWRL